MQLQERLDDMKASYQVIISISKEKGENNHRLIYLMEKMAKVLFYRCMKMSLFMYNSPISA